MKTVTLDCAERTLGSDSYYWLGGMPLQVSNDLSEVDLEFRDDDPDDVVLTIGHRAYLVNGGDLIRAIQLMVG